MMLKEDIDVSVIIPVYNSEKYISQCIKSVLEQKSVHFEVLCIDDMSVDSSRMIIEDISKKNPVVRVFETGVNSGQAVARNLGIKYARGKYLYFMDSDDYLLRNDALSALMNRAIEKNVVSIIDKIIFFIFPS